MGASVSSFPVRQGARLHIELASDERGVREAQALRYQIFGLEMGAKLKSAASLLDIDEFDAYCQHLLVREAKTGASLAAPVS